MTGHVFPAAGQAFSGSTFHLYIDDSGSREPDHLPIAVGGTGMDYFALGGILVRDADIDGIYEGHRTLCERWNIKEPLHSTKIRGRRGPFAWLSTDGVQRDKFYADLQDFLLRLPIIVIAAVVDRPGYVARYKELYQGGTWMICKTAFSILVERAAKFSRLHECRLEIYFEEAGKREDRNIGEYARALKTIGMPFSQATSAGYGALQPADFTDIILGEPRRRTKSAPMIQIADLVLYPLARGDYDPAYAPYRALVDGGKLLDAWVEEPDRASMGVKYSCFDAQKRKDPALAGSRPA